MSNGGTQSNDTLSAIGPENAAVIERMLNDPDPYTRAIANSEFNRLSAMPLR